VWVPISFKVSLLKASMLADFNMAIASLEAIPKAGAAVSSVALERARNTAPGFALDEVPVSPVNTTLAARLIAKRARAALHLRYAVNDFQFLARCHIATAENTTLSHSPVKKKHDSGDCRDNESRDCDRRDDIAG
jgi:hypothetical protein